MASFKKKLMRSNTESEQPSFVAPINTQMKEPMSLDTLVANFVSKHVKAYCKGISRKYVQDEIEEAERHQKLEEKNFSPTSADSSEIHVGPDSGKDMSSPIKLPVHMPYMRPSADNAFAAVVMADVSGYSKLSSILAERGPQGAELLGKVMKGYLDQIIHIILSHGGDIVKFVGDAVIFYWKLKAHSSAEDESDDEDVSPTTRKNRKQERKKMKPAELEQAKGEIVLKAAHCCLELLKKLGTYPINLESCDINILRIHLGIGAGQIYDVHVGHGERWEHFIAGDGINQLATVLDLAKAALSHHALKYFSSVIDIASVNIGNYDKRCIILTGLETAKRKERSNEIVKDFNDLIGEFEEEDIRLNPLHRDREKMIADELIKRFINQSALFKLQMDFNQSKVFRIEAGVEELMAMNELRQATTIFIKIGSLVTTDARLMLETAQEVISIVEGACKKYEGSMRQFHVDDKGAVILLFFGLPPLAHANDAIFGIKAATEIKDKFDRSFDSFSIGLTTGNISIGAVGNAVRTEYALMGDSINMAARLMCHSEAKSNVLCDEKTFKLCENEFSFDSLGETMVKGKSHPIAIFRPKKAKNPIASAKTKEDTKLLDIVGREREKLFITRALQTHITGTGNKLFIMEADGGLGLATMAQFAKKEAKALGCRLCNAAGTELDRRNQFMVVRQFFCDLINASGHKYGIGDDSSNPNIAMKSSSKNILVKIDSDADFGNNVQSFKKQSITSLQAKTSSRYGSLKRKTGQSSGISADALPSPTYLGLGRNFSVATRVSYSQLPAKKDLTFEERLVEAFIHLKEDPLNIPLLNLLFPGQFMENEHTLTFQGKLRVREFVGMLCRLINQMSEKIPVLVLLEESQWIDMASWEVMWEIHAKCPELLIMLYSRPDAQYENEETRLMYNRFKRVTTGQTVLMEGLTRPDTEKMILFSWAKHNADAGDEYGDLVGVEDNLLDTIWERSNGNILYIDSLVFGLKESGGCIVDPVSGLLKLIKLDYRFDKNMKMGDGLTSLIIAQLDRIDREFVLFLKVASVLGQRFSLSDVMFFLSDTPGVLQRLAYEDDNVLTLVERIKAMDKYGYLNRIEDEGMEIILAFKSEIVRKCIYSTMVLSQRQQLHLYVASYYEKMLNDTNRNRLLVQIFEHYAQTDSKQILKKMRYLEAVAHYYYEENLMLEAIEHYTMLLQQADEAQKTIYVTLHNKDIRANWHLELGDAYYARGNFIECEKHLRMAVQLSGYDFPLNETMFKFYSARETLKRRYPLLVSDAKSQRNSNQFRDSAKLQQYLKQIEDHKDKKSTSTGHLDQIIGKNLIATHFQKAMAMNSLSALGTSRFSDCELKVLIQDKKLSQMHCVRRALMVLGQVFFQQGRFGAYSLTVFQALNLSKKFPSDSFYARLMSMKAHAVFLATGNRQMTLQCLIQSLKMDRSDNASHSVRIIQNLSISLLWMGYWDLGYSFMSSLNDLGLESTNFSHRVEAIRMQSFIMFMNGPRSKAVSLSKELYDQSWSNNDWEGKVSSCQTGLACLLTSYSNLEEVQESLDLLKSNWDQAPLEIQNDPALAIVQLGVVGLAEITLSIGLNVGKFLVEFDKQLDKLLRRSNFGLADFQTHEHDLGSSRYWTILIAFVTFGQCLSHCANKKAGPGLNPEVTKMTFAVCRKVSNYLKNSVEMKYFAVNEPVRMWIKGLKFVFQGKSQKCLNIWKKAHECCQDSEFMSCLLAWSISNVVTGSEKADYAEKTQKSFEKLGITIIQ